MKLPKTLSGRLTGTKEDKSGRPHDLTLEHHFLCEQLHRLTGSSCDQLLFQTASQGVSKIHMEGKMQLPAKLLKPAVNTEKSYRYSVSQNYLLHISRLISIQTYTSGVFKDTSYKYTRKVQNLNITIKCKYKQLLMT